MKLIRGEMVFYKYEIRSKIRNVAEVNEKKVEGGGVKNFLVDTDRAVRPGDIYGSLPRRGLLISS
ncbi:hypothetical protein E2C01_007143 [Portunus trituberculatus]|uniref:Uncharacterized protein n=1 Tax=Portunus trituberculatus TaxID=210409 RepID=A0A5B7CYD7_PORTR|nr:hypothetical protein [Portunus trituberculatus]